MLGWVWGAVRFFKEINDTERAKLFKIGLVLRGDFAFTLGWCEAGAYRNVPRMSYVYVYVCLFMYRYVYVCIFLYMYAYVCTCV